MTGRAAPVVYDPLDPEVLADPYPHYDRLRSLAPLHREPRLGVWFVTRHAEVAAVLRDPRFGKGFTAFEGNRVSSGSGRP